ncbi:20881_t:CDS:1, partial [Cetraspora pellucida]
SDVIDSFKHRNKKNNKTYFFYEKRNQESLNKTIAYYNCEGIRDISTNCPFSNGKSYQKSRNVD